MVERRAKETPSVTKPLGRDIRSTKKVDYTKFTKEEPFQTKKPGDGYSHQGPAKATPSKGAERERPGKVDYTKFTKEEPYQTKKPGDGYSHQGPAKATPSKGDERVRGNNKNKSPWRK